MVASIVPGAGPASGALNLEPRFGRPANTNGQSIQSDARAGDTVELSGASLAQARESVREGLREVRATLDLGQSAQVLLLTAQRAAKGEVSQSDLDAAIATYASEVERTLDDGVQLATGQSIGIQAEPGAPALTVEGVDLRLNALLGAEAGADLQRAMETLQTGMSRLNETAAALEAHQGFLGAAESALGVRVDLDVEGARLTALQVRQDLEAVGAVSIANAEPQAVLSLFRA